MKLIGFIGMLDGEATSFCKLLSKLGIAYERVFDLKLCDYLIIGPYLGEKLGFVIREDQVRIFITNEPMTPPVNFVDYAVGFEPMTFLGADGGKRYLQYPYALRSMYAFRNCESWGGMTESNALSVLSKKKYFCNFMYSHASPSGNRERLYSALSRYKKVDSAAMSLT